MLCKYSENDFINDLTKVLIFDTTNLKKNNENLDEYELFNYDESLERNVHLFEHFILLAKGFWRPGLVRLLSWTETQSDWLTTLNSSNKEFNSIMWLIALQQGDFEFFEKSWKGFLQIWGVLDTPGFPIEQKGAAVLYLLHGSTHYTSLFENDNEDNEYNKLFRKLFSKKSDSLMNLHKLATLDENILIQFFKNKNK